MFNCRISKSCAAYVCGDMTAELQRNACERHSYVLYRTHHNTIPRFSNYCHTI